MRKLNPNDLLLVAEEEKKYFELFDVIDFPRTGETFQVVRLSNGAMTLRGMYPESHEEQNYRKALRLVMEEEEEEGLSSSEKDSCRPLLVGRASSE